MLERTDTQRKTHYVYILSGAGRGPLFIGAASDMAARLRQHQTGRVSHPRFRIDRLVYTERYDCTLKAAQRAKALKQASIKWVETLITSHNPAWETLSLETAAIKLAA